VALLRCAKSSRPCDATTSVTCAPMSSMSEILYSDDDSKDKQKLSPPWEGPFIIHEVLRPGTYKI
jgi:hypothetical protein